jgi:hypothetical protein
MAPKLELDIKFQNWPIPMPPINNSINLYPYKFALLAGLTGSAAAFCAKSVLQQDNQYYKFISKYDNGKYLCWVIRSLFFILWVMTNAKNDRV